MLDQCVEEDDRFGDGGRGRDGSAHGAEEGEDGFDVFDGHREECGEARRVHRGGERFLVGEGREGGEGRRLFGRHAALVGGDRACERAKGGEVGRGQGRDPAVGAGFGCKTRIQERHLRGIASQQGGHLLRADRRRHRARVGEGREGVGLDHRRGREQRGVMRIIGEVAEEEVDELGEGHRVGMNRRVAHGVLEEDSSRIFFAHAQDGGEFGGAHRRGHRCSVEVGHELVQLLAEARGHSRRCLPIGVEE